MELNLAGFRVVAAERQVVGSPSVVIWNPVIETMPPRTQISLVL